MDGASNEPSQRTCSLKYDEYKQGISHQPATIVSFSTTKVIIREARFYRAPLLLLCWRLRHD